MKDFLDGFNLYQKIFFLAGSLFSLCVLGMSGNIVVALAIFLAVFLLTMYLKYKIFQYILSVALCLGFLALGYQIYSEYFKRTVVLHDHDFASEELNLKSDKDPFEGLDAAPEGKR